MAITSAQRKLALQVAVADPANASAALGQTQDVILNALLTALGTQFDSQCVTICNYMQVKASAQGTQWTVI